VAGRCNASQEAQDAWDAGDASLASGHNADGSDSGSVFADVEHGPSPLTVTFPWCLTYNPITLLLMQTYNA